MAEAFGVRQIIGRPADGGELLDALLKAGFYAQVKKS